MLNTCVKYCPGCQARKPHSDFTRNKRRHDGLTNYCRVCWRDVSRAQYLKNKDKYAAKYKARGAAAKSGGRSPVACPKCGLLFKPAHGYTECLPCRHGKAVKHGTASTYVRGCRCRPCTDAASANAVTNRRKRLKAAGLPDDNSHKRRARRHGGRHETVNKRLVFQRDGWMCGLCDKLVDKALTWPDPLSVSIDHVVPLSRGGDHTYDNVQCSHLRCNQNKQHKIA